MLPSSTVNTGCVAQKSDSLFKIDSSCPNQMIMKKKVNTSRKENLCLANPACMAGVRISDPNFKARCGLRKL